MKYSIIHKTEFNSRNNSDNISHKRLTRHFAQHLTKFCVDHLRSLLKSKHLDNIKWGDRNIIS